MNKIEERSLERMAIWFKSDGQDLIKDANEDEKILATGFRSKGSNQISYHGDSCTWDPWDQTDAPDIAMWLSGKRKQKTQNEGIHLILFIQWLFLSLSSS